MNNKKNKLLEKCIKNALKKFKVENENISSWLDYFDSITINNKDNINILTNWELSKFVNSNLKTKLGINLKIFNNDKMSYKDLWKILDDKDSYYFVHMVEFAPHYMGDLLKRDKTFYNSSDIDLNLPGFFSYLFYNNDLLKDEFYISCLGFDEAEMFRRIYEKTAFTNPFLFTGLIFLRWYDFLFDNFIPQKKLISKKVIFTGNIFNNVLGNKLEFLLKGCKKLQDLDIDFEFINGHVPIKNYSLLLNESLLTLCHCRFQDSILTRAIDAYVCGSIPVLNDNSLTNYFFKDNSFITLNQFLNCSDKIDLKKLINRSRYKPSLNEILENAISNIRTGIKLEFFYRNLTKNYRLKKEVRVINKYKNSLDFEGTKKFIYKNKDAYNIYLYAGRKLEIPKMCFINLNKFKSVKALSKKFPKVNIYEDKNLKINRTGFTQTLKHNTFERVYEIYKDKQAVEKTIIDLCIDYLYKKKSEKKKLVLNKYLTHKLIYEISQTIIDINFSINHENNSSNSNSLNRKEELGKTKIYSFLLKLNSLFRISLCCSNEIDSFDIVLLIDKSIKAIESIEFKNDFKNSLMIMNEFFLPFDFLSNTLDNHSLVESIKNINPLLYKKVLKSSFEIIRFSLTGIKNDICASLNTNQNNYIISLIRLLDIKYFKNIAFINTQDKQKDIEIPKNSSKIRSIFYKKINEEISTPNLITNNAKFLFI